MTVEIEEINQMNETISDGRGASLFSRNKDEKHVELKDFTIKAVIGRGTFGKVFLVQREGYQQFYAMKSLRKDSILEHNLVDSTLLEKEILQKADHPFLVGMDFVFQTDVRIFFIMKFFRGGELYMHLKKAKRFSEKRAKFYACTVTMALAHLH